MIVLTRKDSLRVISVIFWEFGRLRSISSIREFSIKTSNLLPVTKDSTGQSEREWLLEAVDSDRHLQSTSFSRIKSQL